MSSTLIAVKVFLETNTFMLTSDDLVQLSDVSSFFKANVQSVFLKSTGLSDFGDVFKHPHCITDLSVNDNHTKFEFLNQNSSVFLPRLKRLDVYSPSKSSFTSFCKNLKANSTVEILNIGDFIGIEGATALAEAFKVNSTVKQIDLMFNSIDNAGTKTLAGALKINSSISVLHLMSNFIGNEGVVALADTLKTNSTIVLRDLSSNSIAHEGSIALAEALKVNSTVTEIDLMANCIGDVGITALASALKVNCTLTVMNLKLNSIGIEGATALAEALKENSSVTKIDLGSNSIGDEGAMVMADALRDNSSIIAVTLKNNSIDPLIQQYVKIVSEGRLC
ncbi:hypothetical protein GEMRC1_008641 [Eukaryota sp. GEM-RC1]